VRSIIAAAVAGMAFAITPAIFSTYLPQRWIEVPTMLFGLGAIGVARHPEGVVLQTARQLRSKLHFASAPAAGAGSRVAGLQGVGNPEPAGTMTPASVVPGTTETEAAR
jgi:branched-chain amino acid transport system permease protein